MTDAPSPSFAFSVEGDAYSTAKKIMGRQAAGQAFLRALGRTWPNATLQGVATGRFSRDHTLSTLKEGGFQGQVQLSSPPGFQGARKAGALYFPAVPNAELARLRNRLSPGAFSIFGVTHTLSTDRTIDAISAMALPPFRDWDALICTSQVARDVVTDILERHRDQLRTETGATRLPIIQTPIIPLGVPCQQWERSPDAIAAARARLGLAPDETAFLFAGRLAFNSKANPAEMYQGLQAISGEAKVVCVEAGLHPHEGFAASFEAARRLLAPNVRFIHARGDDAQAYADAWRAADVFVSLSDNIQETFGLTPVEAMAAGIPVICSDWNGYRSNIRHGVDGFLIPTTAPSPRAGDGLELAVQFEELSYDRFIGLLSLTVTVDHRLLRSAMLDLATDRDLRRRMGAAGRQRALEMFDWSKVLARYDELARELSAMRIAAGETAPQAWTQRRNPYERFGAFPSHTLSDADRVEAAPDAARRLREIMALDVASYAVREPHLPAAAIQAVLNDLLTMGGEAEAAALLGSASGDEPVRRRALSWLSKFAIVEVRPS
jgi:glycosyltransferase involved in cell wall biosynthesis